VDFVVFLQGIATFFEDILFFAAQDCIGNLISFRTTLLYFFTRLNKKTNVVWDLRSSHRYILFLVEVLYHGGFTIVRVRDKVAYCCFFGSLFAFQVDEQTSTLSGTCIANFLQNFVWDPFDRGGFFSRLLL